MPSQPTSKDIERDFPIAFTAFNLSTGKSVILRSKYIGQDYSGRYGNYFCHALIYDRAEVNTPAICYYESPIFRDRLTETEAGREELPSYLPYIEKLQTGEQLTLDTVLSFASRREKPFCALLRSFLKGYMNGKKCVFTSTSEENPLFMGALLTVLPPFISKKLSWTTYTQQPVSSQYSISAVSLEGARFSPFQLENHPDYIYIDLSLLSPDIKGVVNEAEYIRILMNLLPDAKQTRKFLEFIISFQPETMEQLDLISLFYECINIKAPLVSNLIQMPWGEHPSFLARLIVSTWDQSNLEERSMLLELGLNKLTSSMSRINQSILLQALWKSAQGRNYLIQLFKHRAASMKQLSTLFNLYDTEISNQNMDDSTTFYLNIIKEYVYRMPQDKLFTFPDQLHTLLMSVTRDEKLCGSEICKELFYLLEKEYTQAFIQGNSAERFMLLTSEPYVSMMKFLEQMRKSLFLPVSGVPTYWLKLEQRHELEDRSFPEYINLEVHQLVTIYSAFIHAEHAKSPTVVSSTVGSLMTSQENDDWWSVWAQEWGSMYKLDSKRSYILLGKTICMYPTEPVLLTLLDSLPPNENKQVKKIMAKYVPSPQFSYNTNGFRFINKRTKRRYGIIGILENIFHSITRRGKL
ncbi:hypothetical protein FPZ49_19175 [Paenibacillus cremeus]|uniref:Uncharacterized protein n=1 Tax=Paenibacillus cremeus TaxID=2163881 RepID=A0A559K8A4_9BACL|nr:hypothetical protein FPZ49_19175 [Paenibacillus cremeus]